MWSVRVCCVLIFVVRPIDQLTSVTLCILLKLIDWLFVVNEPRPQHLCVCVCVSYVDCTGIWTCDHLSTGTSSPHRQRTRPVAHTYNHKTCLNSVPDNETVLAECRTVTFVKMWGRPKCKNVLETIWMNWVILTFSYKNIEVDYSQQIRNNLYIFILVWTPFNKHLNRENLHHVYTRDSR